MTYSSFKDNLKTIPYKHLKKNGELAIKGCYYLEDEEWKKVKKNKVRWGGFYL